ncbi:MAG: Benzoyl-CoA reductase subunit D [Planctomycetes bacterium]|nr:Benzoyl-CoA reductase subunit D [Planctomycetota bacterium]
MTEARGVTVAGGIDVGAGAVKAAVVRTGNGAPELLATADDRIRRRDPKAVVDEVWHAALAKAGLRPDQIEYLASTGEGELVDGRTGHFYSMTTHARGARFFIPDCTLVLDAGALHARAMLLDPRSRPVSYRMTSQCASGGGQFVENITRYLGVTLDEVGELSLQAKKPEVVSSVCAVLAETDVINMVSRGITTSDILKGIHLSMAGRFARLVASLSKRGVLAVTGGLANDVGLMAAMGEEFAKCGAQIDVRTHPHSIHAGAVGAAIWGAFRHRRLAATAGATAGAPA